MIEIEYLLSSDPELQKLGKQLILSELDIEDFFNQFEFYPQMLKPDSTTFILEWLDYIIESRTRIPIFIPGFICSTMLKNSEHIISIEEFLNLLEKYLWKTNNQQDSTSYHSYSQ